MKILKLRVSDFSSEIYVGNDFSPDPLEMLEKIRTAGAIGTETDRTMHFITESKDKFEKAQEDVKKLLTKNGYVLYNPCTVLIDCKTGKRK
ncbi:hypothetical protein ACQ27_gp251 [Klebsiella phage K64-1]|uniref:hypothetical protein n=1 Tax=Klebsiella phage K64-1 TaxID=1439894 RepID=UPI00248B40A3|nr:hypothetical protein ACQ27_gp251 [Klebsiella phage K64-1]